MKTIMLDAGHYGNYNQSPVVPKYYESVQMWKLMLFLKTELEKYGFTVKQTRNRLKDDLAVVKRGNLAKDCDLFLSLHSNAIGGSGNEKVDRVDVFYAFDNFNSASVLAKELAMAIAECMGIDKYNAKTRKSEKGNWDYYGVLRGARNVGCPLYFLLEHSFHTNKRSAEWLLKEENLKKLAKAEALVIAKYFDMLPEGDVNGDGVADVKDYTLVKRIAFDTYNPNPQEARRADLNSDGAIDAKDYTLLKRKVLKG